MTLLERLEAAIENLRTHQKQLDADGIMVGVSRQALKYYVNMINSGDRSNWNPEGGE